MKRYSEASGLYMYLYRHYEAEHGRWPSRDSIMELNELKLSKEFLADINTKNRKLLSDNYRFNSNSTCIKVDLLGLSDVFFLGVTTEIRPPDAQAGIKSTHGVNVELDTAKIIAEHSSIGTTTVPGVGHVGGMTHTDGAVASLNSNKCIMTVGMWVGTRSAVLLVLITYDVTLKMRVKGFSNVGRYTIKGKHDGNHSYIVSMSGTPIYDHQQKNLIILLGSGDVKVDERGIAYIQ